jgi:hypothetical protein
VIPADLRSSEMQSVDGGYGATVGETRPEEPGVLIVPRARFYDLVPACELPYGPAASSLHHQRPGRWQHQTTCRSSSKIACISRGVHR